MGFSQIRPNPKISSEKKKAYFRKNPAFGENFPVSGEIFQFSAKVPDSGDAFSSDFDAFFNSGNRSDPTDANHHRKPNRSIFPAVGFGLLRPSTRCRRVDSGLGRKPTRPDPWTALLAAMSHLWVPASLHTLEQFFTLSHTLPLHDSHLNTGFLIAKIQANLVRNKANKMID